MPIFGPDSLMPTELRVGRYVSQAGMAIVLLAALSLGGGLLRVSTAAAAQAEGVAGAEAAEEGLDLWMPAALGVGALVLLVLLLSDGRRRHAQTTVAGKARAAVPAPGLTRGRGHGSERAAHEGSPVGLPRPAATAATAAPGGAQRSPDPPPNPAVASPRFLVEGSQLSFPLDRDEVRLGSAPENDICLPEERVSGFHAAVRRAGAGWLLHDCNSTNGTLLNDGLLEPWQDRPLRSGDRVRIGPYVLWYEER